ncbi:MAG: excinuclease ABC subunit UvrC [Gammaproteobacteria bacterium]
MRWIASRGFRPLHYMQLRNAAGVREHGAAHFLALARRSGEVATLMSDSSPQFDGKAFGQTLTVRPGVYRMFDAQGTVLYVGKARNLKKRVESYFGSPSRLSAKTRVLVARIASMQVTATHTEAEALLLESNLIKELKPRYNVTLRDDKSFPWIYLASEQEFPRLRFHRGARKGKGRYFGPYPNAGAVRSTLNLLQKLFRIRNCTDGFFRARSRPCLQYQIKRCSAPCVGLIGSAAYREDVEHAALFLEGKGAMVIAELVKRMEAAAEKLNYEVAARYRDQIAQLKQVEQRQYVSQEDGDCDIVAMANDSAGACVQLFIVRGGRNLGNRTFFPANTEGADAEEVLYAFLTQHYLDSAGDDVVPPLIVISHAIAGIDVLCDALSQHAAHKVSIRHDVRGERARWLTMASENAELALKQRRSLAGEEGRRLEALQQFLRLEDPIERIECFDISHTMGEATVASCVVFGIDGAIKSDYRRFNIEGITAGDDYGAMRQAVERRYARVQREEGRLPEVLLIDGGVGQVTQAQRAMNELGITDVSIVGVAKGPARKPGQEVLILADSERQQHLPPDSPALHLIQAIRDEAHRFAISGHRQRRGKARTTSTLEEIEGIGAQRRRTLIQHFGGLQGVARAGIKDLSRVPDQQ